MARSAGLCKYVRVIMGPQPNDSHARGIQERDYRKQDIALRGGFLLLGEGLFFSGCAVVLMVSIG